jgi:hypothetical protein
MIDGYQMGHPLLLKLLEGGSMKMMWWPILVIMTLNGGISLTVCDQRDVSEGNSCNNWSNPH